MIHCTRVPCYSTEMNHALEDRLAEDNEGLRATVLEVRVRLCESAIRLAILAATLERIASLPAPSSGRVRRWPGAPSRCPWGADVPPLVPAIAGRFRCTCEKCHAFHELEAADVDAAWRAFKALGWLDLARKGKGRAAYPWWYPACAPKGATSMGRSTI